VCGLRFFWDIGVPNGFPPDSQLHVSHVLPKMFPITSHFTPINLTQNFTLVINIARSKGTDIQSSTLSIVIVFFLVMGQSKEAGYQNKNARYQLHAVLGSRAEST
jgi:hypothetical protein